MKKGYLVSLTCFLMLGMLFIPQLAAAAQAGEPTSPPPEGVATPMAATVINPFPATPELAELERGENVSFRLLNARDVSMIGPFDSYYLSVGIPAHWKLTGDAKMTLKLNLDLTVAPNQPGNFGTWLGPRLDVYFDDIFITSLRVKENGDYTFEIPLPVSQMQPVRAGSHFLYMYLDASYDCEYDQSTVLTVKADSFFTLPHESAGLNPNLNNLPIPFFQFYSFLPNQVTLVLPDNPSDSELRAGMIVAAGMGRMTTNKLDMAALSAGQLTNDIEAASNIIYVGKAGSIPALSNLKLPAPLSGSKFETADALEDDGIIQMVVSDGNPDRAIMVVGGNTDAGVIKAAQAVSTGSIRATQNARLAIVSGVSTADTSTSKFNVDRTFADLGYENITMTGLGTVTTEYIFMLPGGYRVGDDAYLDLRYSYSGLLDFGRSSVSVILNGSQVNSSPYTSELRSENTQPNHLALPAYAFIPGVNSLVVQSNHVNEHCAYYSPTEIWTTIYNSSLLHIPPSTQVEKQMVAPNFTNFPRPLTDDPDLTSITFVLDGKDPAALFTASKIAEDLGRQTSSSLVNLNAVYSENMTDDLKNNSSLVLVGKPTDLPMIAELNESLPAPFASGSNTADESGLSVSYRMSPDTSIGYMEFFQSPWNAERVILAALGSTSEGLKWAGTALTDPLFATQLTGDYAVTNGVQVYGVDTQAAGGTNNIAVTAAPGTALAVTPAALALGAVPTSALATKTTIFDADPKLWVPYAIVIVTILTILVVVFVVLMNNKKNRDEKFKLHD